VTVGCSGWLSEKAPEHDISRRCTRSNTLRLWPAAAEEGAMHGFKGERVLMRIHIGERDKYHGKGKPLYQAIVELLRTRHYAGVTVLRAIMGFGASSKLHTDRIEVLSLDLPIVIECIDTEEKIEAILPELDEMIGGGLITLERAKVIMYRPHRPEEERTGSWPIDLTGSWRSEGPADGAPGY
jgi:PII-like signaling protein